jgi:hypothetical protein
VFLPSHCAALLLSAAKRGEKGLASEDGKWRKMIGVGRLGSSKETGMGNIVFMCENNDVKLFCMSCRWRESCINLWMVYKETFQRRREDTLS